MLLNLPSITVTRTEENDLNYQVYATPTKGHTYCIHCFCFTLYGHGTKQQSIMDIPINGKHVYIQLKRKRYKCKDCSKTFFQECSDISDNHRATNRLVKYIEKAAIKKPCTSVADEVGVTEGTVRNILNSYIRTLDPLYIFEAPEVLGFGQSHLNNTVRLVFVNTKERTIIDLVSNRKKESIINSLSRLKDREKIKAVTMDMWEPSRDAVETVLPNAVIIIENYHIINMINLAVDKSYISIKDRLEVDLGGSNKKGRNIMLSRRKALSKVQQDTLKEWAKSYPPFFELYEAKEQLLDIFDSKSTRTEAEEAYTYWKGSVTTRIKSYFSSFDRIMGGWHKEVFNYFDYPYTSTCAKPANNLIQYMYKQGHGYSFEVLRAKVLFQPENHKIKESSKFSVPSGVIDFAKSNTERLNFGTIIPEECDN